jgi:2-keto-4-pentenoate hydratase
MMVDGGCVALEDFLQPLIEPKVAVVLGDGLIGDVLTVADVLAATAFVIPAFEIVDRRIGGLGLPPVTDIIADNGWLGRVVFGGPPRTLTDVRLGATPVELQVDGKILARGRSGLAGVHPAQAVISVAKLLHRMGLGLQPGQAVLTGACSHPYLPRQASTVRAVFGGLGDVEVSLTRTNGQSGVPEHSADYLHDPAPGVAT